MPPPPQPTPNKCDMFTKICHKWNSNPYTGNLFTDSCFTKLIFISFVYVNRSAMHLILYIYIKYILVLAKK